MTATLLLLNRACGDAPPFSRDKNLIRKPYVVSPARALIALLCTPVLLAGLSLRARSRLDFHLADHFFCQFVLFLQALLHPPVS